MATRGSSLRDKQIVSIKKILNLNESLEPSENDDPHGSGFLAPTAPILKDGRPIWKVLVFDDLGRDVISPVLQVSHLRSMGVTMHMLVVARVFIVYGMFLIPAGIYLPREPPYRTFPLSTLLNLSRRT
jgi:ABC-type antimicrobial peptide transport system permease subunit